MNTKEQIEQCVKSLEWLKFNIVGTEEPKKNTFEYAAKVYLENAIELLKDSIKYTDIKEELGLPLNVWVFLAKNQLKENPENVYIENTIDDEKQRERGMKVNGRPQRFILGIDFDEKYIQVQGTADEWCFKVPFSDYGKTWALTKEELL